MRACIKGDCSEEFNVEQGLRQGCVLSPLLLNIFFAAVLLVALYMFSKDPNILAEFVHLQEQPAKVGPETAMECARRAVWGMLHADDACIVLHSLKELERMMATLVDVFGAFGLTVSDKNRKLYACRSRNANNIHYNANYLGGAFTERFKISADIDRWIRAGWMSFNHYRAELYDRPRLLSTYKPGW